jgi:hypothetical protein
LNLLSAKWLHDVQHNKGPEFLVKQAYIDFITKCPVQKSSSFYYPLNQNPITIKYHKQCVLSESIESLDTIDGFQEFCKSSSKRYHSKLFLKFQLPTPPNGFTIIKALHALGIPRDKLRLVLFWLCGYVPYIGDECAKCKEKISKSHLESCVLRSPLPNAQPGKRIDNLLYKAVNTFHARSARLAAKVLYNEITNAFPPLQSQK